MLPHFMSDTFVSVTIDGTPKVANQDHPNFEEIRNRVRSKNFEGIEELFDVGQAIETWAQGNIEIVGGVLRYNGQQIENVIVDHIFEVIDEGHNADHLIKFLENLLENPSYRAVQELYGFLEAGQMSITEDGCFLAYKKVRADFTDIYTGQFDNSIGQVVSMPRNQVDEDSERTCSRGLHVCSYDYLRHFGSSTGNKVVLCKINPADVVAIPKDYNNTKMRVCRYEVLEEVENYQEDNVLNGMSVYCTAVDDLEDVETEITAGQIYDLIEYTFGISTQYREGDTLVIFEPDDIQYLTEKLGEVSIGLSNDIIEVDKPYYFADLLEACQEVADENN